MLRDQKRRGNAIIGVLTAVSLLTANIGVAAMPVQSPIRIAAEEELPNPPIIWPMTAETTA